jgi:pyridoxamine 5'-phosphate oxidase
MINKEHLGKLRREYQQKGLIETDAADDPINQFSLWFNESLELGLLDANAMSLATSTPEGKPSNRIVLLKGFDEKGFIFYTNYNSRKGIDLISNPFASLLFYWEELSRQVRIEGKAERLSSADSAEYFNSRPVESKLGAWASEQSSVIKNREELEKRYEELEKLYAEQSIPKPEHWGGFRIIPEIVEFWQGRPNRLHDRIVFYKKDNIWEKKRLAP